MRSTIGIANARVLPDPVGDFASTSRPASASGRTKDWIVNGPDRARGERVAYARGHAELAETAVTWCSTPLRVRDLPTSKHPKEEREAHLTGRLDCRPSAQSSNTPAFPARSQPERNRCTSYPRATASVGLRLDDQREVVAGDDGHRISRVSAFCATRPASSPPRRTWPSGRQAETTVAVFPIRVSAPVWAPRWRTVGSRRRALR